MVDSEVFLKPLINLSPCFLNTLDRQIGSTSAATASYDPTVKRRLFAGFRPLSGFGLLRMRSSQNRSISLPESKFQIYFYRLFFIFFLIFLTYKKLEILVSHIWCGPIKWKIKISNYFLTFFSSLCSNALFFFVFF